MTALMNNTKWEKLRLSMCALQSLHIRWRTKDLSGHVSEWDGDWYYHFRDGGYKSIEWVEIRVSAEQHAAVLSLLQRIHLPGHCIPGGFRIYGYSPAGTAVSYI
jgi:hypothetical protein